LVDNLCNKSLGGHTMADPLWRDPLGDIPWANPISGPF
jgi:hypothetical protein